MPAASSLQHSPTVIQTALFAGLGARELASDEDVVPVRGQVRRVRAPWVKHAMFLDGTYYILPNVDSLVVGGTTQRGDERTEVDWADHTRIWDNILHMCPSLANAETVTDWVRYSPGTPCARASWDRRHLPSLVQHDAVHIP